MAEVMTRAQEKEEENNYHPLSGCSGKDGTPLVAGSRNEMAHGEIG